MQTTSNSNRKNFALGLIGGLGLAAALGAAFLLGGRTGGANADPQTAAEPVAVSPTATTGAPASNGGPVVQTDPQDHEGSAPADNGDTQADQSGDGPAVEPTATPESEEPADEGDGDGPTATPTSTPEPGGCPFCIDPEIVLPLPTEEPEPCPFCLDVDLVLPVDVTPPTISDIETEFCYPILTVSLEVDAPAEVWFEYEYDGNDYESVHKDAANDAFITEDMDSFGWGVYLIDSIDVHAVDLAGNHAMTTVAMPDPDLGC
jgi:hypothetical protein